MKLWHFLPKGKWNGSVAAETYRGPVHRALKTYRGQKRKYVVLEDNDPTGYKSRAAEEAKAELGICAMEYPKYSPDLNPMDYFLWSEVQRRMDKQSAPANKSQKAYKVRMRRTAFAIPRSVIQRAVAGIKARAQAAAPPALNLSELTA